MNWSEQTSEVYAEKFFPPSSTHLHAIIDLGFGGASIGCAESSVFQSYEGVWFVAPSRVNSTRATILKTRANLRYAVCQKR